MLVYFCCSGLVLSLGIADLLFQVVNLLVLLQSDAVLQKGILHALDSFGDRDILLQGTMVQTWVNSESGEELMAYWIVRVMDVPTKQTKTNDTDYAFNCKIIGQASSMGGWTGTLSNTKQNPHHLVIHNQWILQPSRLSCRDEIAC